MHVVFPMISLQIILQNSKENASSNNIKIPLNTYVFGYYQIINTPARIEKLRHCPNNNSRKHIAF